MTARVGVVVAAAVIAMSCGLSRVDRIEHATDLPAAPAPPWEVTYHDGSGNVVRVWRESAAARFEYRPVTPDQSSSGTYSGGEPATGEVSDTGAKELWLWIRRIGPGGTPHSGARRKGTGLLRLTATTGSQQLLLERDRLLEEFEDFLRELRQQPS